LGLDPDAFVFAFGAVDIENRRKGAALLLEALQQIADVPNVIGLVLGGGDLPEMSTPLPPLRSLGFVKEMERRIFIYSACDLFVLPSTEDNMPLTGLEALASGTPIVAFDAGGLPDFVRPNETGLLARVDDPVGLGNQIRYLADHRDEAEAMGKKAREVALSEYSDEREANDYVELYAALLDRAGSAV
jgi:glycosyltransferase involved in cell wall biosynthesis